MQLHTADVRMVERAGLLKAAGARNAPLLVEATLAERICIIVACIPRLLVTASFCPDDTVKTHSQSMV
jgi:hypothetical protein